MKSANADEIFGFASDEIKSTHPPSRRISSNEVGFHRRRRFHPPARVDLVEKSTDKVDAFFWQGWRDLNSRVPESKSGALTAWLHPYIQLRYYIQFRWVCQGKWEIYTEKHLSFFAESFFFS